MNEPTARERVQELLDSKRPDRYDPHDHGWQEPIVDEVAAEISDEEARQVAAQQIVSTTGVEYRGRNRSGTHVVGRLSPGRSLAEFVEGCYDARWRELIVERDGLEVGAIVPHPDNGQRIWWAGLDDDDGVVGYEPDPEVAAS